MVIYMALEVFRAVIPRASANEHATRKPFRAIVTVWSTTIRSVVIVTVRAFRSRSNVDIDLSLHFRNSHREADSSQRNYRKKFPSLHKSSSVVVRALVYLLLGYSLGEKKNKRDRSPQCSTQRDLPLRDSSWRRNSTRRILPLTVFGSSSTNSISRGYL